jgi:hypothetical protein
MEPFALEFSVVVAGQDCNPTILNPDFLKLNRIVSDEWGWRPVDPIITTPPFSMVTYDSGVTVTVETNRFQVSDNKRAGDVSSSKAPSIVRSYVKTLPHVRYTAVGINIRSFVEAEEADKEIENRFLLSGYSKGMPEKPIGVGLNFVFPIDGGKLTLSIGSVTANIPVGEIIENKRGISMGANFHRDCTGYPSYELVIAHVEKTHADIDRFESIVRALFARKGKE